MSFSCWFSLIVFSRRTFERKPKVLFELLKIVLLFLVHLFSESLFSAFMLLLELRTLVLDPPKFEKLLELRKSQEYLSFSFRKIT